jgi:hypothetical protein
MDIAHVPVRDALDALENTLAEAYAHLDRGDLVTVGETLNVAAIHRNTAQIALQKVMAADKQRRLARI